MLTLARVESGPSEADRPQAGVSASCDIAECVRDTIAQLRTVAALHAVDVVVQSTDDSRVPLAADDCAIVIENLLMNALQHSPRNAKVYLTLRSENATIELTVADQGEGIDPSALPHIFDRFYRGDPSRARSTGGAGLGLAICKAVVERAGGTIELKSEPGKGTTAIVRLPKGLKNIRAWPVCGFSSRPSPRSLRRIVPQTGFSHPSLCRGFEREDGIHRLNAYRDLLVHRSERVPLFGSHVVTAGPAISKENSIDRHEHLKGAVTSVRHCRRGHRDRGALSRQDCLPSASLCNLVRVSARTRRLCA